MTTNFVDGSTVITAAWLNSVETARNKVSELAVSVKDFGAIGDGVTDDSAAIQLAVDYLKSIVATNKVITLLFPQGIYRIVTGINLTGITKFIYWGIEAYEANFVLECTGKAGFDMMGSRSCFWRGGTITGSQTLTPKVAIQIGRGTNPNVSTDCHIFDALDVNGYFSLACIYNYASEGCAHRSVRLSNNYPSDSAYCLVMDGENIFDIKSDYFSIAPQYTAAPFNDCVFDVLDARRGVQGSAIWMCRTLHHSYTNSYAVSYTSAAIVLYSGAASSSNKLLTLDVHCETAGLTANIELQSLSATTVYVHGLHHRDHSTHASEAVIKLGSGVTYALFTGCRLEVNHLSGGTPALFSPAASINFQGDIYNYDSDDVLNIASAAKFNGTFTCVDRTLKTFPVSSTASYRIADDNGTYTMGRITLVGNDTNNYSLISFESNTGTAVDSIICDNTNHNINVYSNGVLASVTNSSSISPGVDNTINLGSGSKRYGTVYAATGTINTSDRREKQQIQDLTTAERAVAVKLKTLIKSFKFNSAVAENGDQARIHFGVIAQDVISAFALEGLDATKYALLCYDQWDETVDEEGKVTPAGDRYGVRYDELLAFMISVL